MGAGLYELSSGFTVRVKTLGPFALDPIRKRHKDPGLFTYQVETKAEGVVDFLYEIPDPPPTRPPSGDEQGEWELYQAFLAHQRKRRVVLEGFEAESTDLVMLNCFGIVSGPYSVEDDDWLDRLLPFLDERPEGAARLLLFLKTQVFAVSFEEWSTIRQACVAPEVSVEGILDALESFRPDLGRGGGQGDMGPAAQGEIEP